jgi:hypothetical protein
VNTKSATGSSLRNIELEIEERINVEDLKNSINKIVERLHLRKLQKPKIGRLLP